MTDTLQPLRIALFGGSFDPPHIAHRDIAIYLLQNKIADQVWYVPVKHHPFGKTVHSDTVRVEMLTLMLEQMKKEHPELAGQLRIETHELEQDQVSYTLETLQSLRQKYPQHHFRWVIGTDNLAKFNQWNGYPQILQEFGVIVYPREGSPAEPLREGMEFLADAPKVTVSSTEVRALAAAGKTLEGRLTPEVAGYIQAHDLYH